MEIIMRLSISPTDICTAQQKGVRIVRGKPYFYTKGVVERSNKMIREAMVAELRQQGIELVTVRELKYGKWCERTVVKNKIPREKPVTVSIAYVFPYTSSTRKAEKLHGWCWMLERPDVDNLTKSVLDQLTEIGIWADDSQLIDLRVVKFRAERPLVQVKVSTESDDAVPPCIVMR